MLILQNADVGYCDDVIVSSANLRVNAGDWLALLGPNGGGKTTLMKALIGILPLQSGKRTSDFTRVGYVPQRFSLTLSSPMQVREFLDLNPQGNPRDHTYNKGLTEELLIAPLLNQRIKHLSGGQLQRVMLAYALYGKPDLIFLDEFLDGIDSESNKRVLETLSQRNKNGLTILEISHDFATIVQHANRAILVKRRILYDGTPQDKSLQAQLLSAHQYHEWVKHAEPS